ncbi:MAG: hypothetical protein ACM3Q1_03030 [Bacteroidales bacterium]
MRSRRGESCPWHFQSQPESDLRTLQSILNCASHQSCDDCVPCSERALDLFRQAAQSAARD